MKLPHLVTLSLVAHVGGNGQKNSEHQYGRFRVEEPSVR